MAMKWTSAFVIKFFFVYALTCYYIEQLFHEYALDMGWSVRALELHYPMVQFLINAKLKYTLSFDRDCKLRITL